MEQNIYYRIRSQEFQSELFGNFDRNIQRLENFFSINIVLRDDNIVLIGEEKNASNALKVLEKLEVLVSQGGKIDLQAVNYALEMFRDHSGAEEDISTESILITSRGSSIKAKTLGQKNYIQNIKNNDITVCIGPAGTGKTYLAVAMAAKAFNKEEVSRIILTRPAVEAGESLGFLPGDLKDKVDPYLRPLYDALFDIFGAEKFGRLMEKGAIEVAPLAYMRGRTLDNAFIILDEAQNTTSEQMKMFLTRLGYGSKAVVTGDITQIDLPASKKSGLVIAADVLKSVSGVAIALLNERDVVRHELVQRIIKAYEKYEQKSPKDLKTVKSSSKKFFRKQEK
ncbi:MAG: PhoH family protein [Peptostreptococcaceae bacterium]|nr:PhoH family protein [Peptostreptococcaceae bacterium]